VGANTHTKTTRRRGNEVAAGAGGRAAGVVFSLATISAVTETVEIYSATDPVYFTDRQVWYWVEVHGMTVNTHAEAILAEHDACLIDRSDKGCGLLRSMLG